MYFIRCLRSLIWGVLRFVRTYFWRVLSLNPRLLNTRPINMELENECEFDSTWEYECENKQSRKKLYRMSLRNENAARDMQNFRHSCRNLDDDDNDDDESNEVLMYNLEFYHGRIKSSPDDFYIDEFHKQWEGQYVWLENCHSYIQWLFPIQERGVNWEAHVLTKKEIKVFRKDKEAKSKLVKSYKLMLDFYGIRLVNETTGEVERAENWKDRFKDLNRYSHNNLRITRILKCLGTLGLQHYQAPLVKFFLRETLVEGQLQSVKQSVLDYFMFTVLDKSERRKLVRFAFENFWPQRQFVWAPKEFLSGEVGEENTDNKTEEHRQRRETDKRIDEVNNIDASSCEGTAKQIRKMSVGDIEKLGEVHNENENLFQTEENRTGEDVQQRETSQGTQEVNQTDANNTVRNQNDNEKELQVMDVQPVKMDSDKNNKDEQDPDENSQCSSNNKKTEKQDQETSDDSNEEHCKPHEDIEHATECNTTEDGQEGEKPNLSTNEMNKMDASCLPEGMGNETPSKKDNQNIDNPDSPGKLVQTNKNNEDEQDPVKNSRCGSNGKKAEKQD